MLQIQGFLPIGYDDLTPRRAHINRAGPDIAQEAAESFQHAGSARAHRVAVGQHAAMLVGVGAVDSVQFR